MLCHGISKGIVCIWIQKHPKCATAFFIATISVSIGLICGCIGGLTASFIGAGSTALSFTLIAMIRACKKNEKNQQQENKTKPTTVSSKKSIITNVSTSQLPSPTAISDGPFTWNHWTASFNQKNKRYHWHNSKTHEDYSYPPQNSPWFPMKDLDGLPFHWKEWSRVFDFGYDDIYYFNTINGESLWDPPQGTPWHTKAGSSPTLSDSDISKRLLIQWGPWKKMYSPTESCNFYYNSTTGEYTLDPPAGSPWVETIVV